MMPGTTGHRPMASPTVGARQNKELAGAYALDPTMDCAQQLAAGGRIPDRTCKGRKSERLRIQGTDIPEFNGMNGRIWLQPLAG